MIWVAAQAILIGLILFLPLESDFDLPEWLIIATNILSVAGFIILFRAIFDLRHSPSIQPKPNETGTLRTKGIYNYIRHPMYVAVWFIFAAIVLRSGSLPKIVILFPLIITFFSFKVLREEGLLNDKYPGYKKYKKSRGIYAKKERTHSWHKQNIVFVYASGRER